jgi:hypothetical protein
MIYKSERYEGRPIGAPDGCDHNFLFLTTGFDTGPLDDGGIFEDKQEVYECTHCHCWKIDGLYSTWIPSEEDEEREFTLNKQRYN